MASIPMFSKHNLILALKKPHGASILSWNGHGKVLKFWCPHAKLETGAPTSRPCSLNKLMSPSKPQFLHLKSRNNNHKSVCIVIIYRAG